MLTSNLEPRTSNLKPQTSNPEPRTSNLKPRTSLRPPLRVMLLFKSMIRSHKGITPQVPDTSYVDDSAQIIGDVILGEHSSIWMNAVLRGDVHEIRVGHYSNIQDNCVLHGMK